MLTREQILDVERLENSHHERIGRTFRQRSESKEAWQAWKDATSEWHQQRYPTDRLWTDTFLRLLRTSDRAAIEDAVLYLEVDPWYFRSGYLKERLIRGLKAASLSEKDRLRLRHVVWNVVRGRNRRELRRYCSLALRVLTPEFEHALDRASVREDRACQGKLAI